MVPALVAAGADPMARGDSGWTPLHVVAFAARDVKVAEALIAAGADPNAQDQTGMTPWDRVQRKGEKTPLYWLLNDLRFQE